MNDNNNMDQRALVAIVLCVALYAAFNYYMKLKYPEPAAQIARVQTTETVPLDKAPASTPSERPADLSEKPVIAQLSADELTLQTSTSIYRFSQDASALQSVTLKSYQSAKGNDAGPINLIEHPLYLQGITDIARTQPVKGGFHAKREGQSLSFWRETGDWRIAQTFTTPETGYAANLEVSFTNMSTRPLELTAGVLTNETIVFPKNKGGFSFIPGAPTEVQSFVDSVDGKTKWQDLRKQCEGEPAIKLTNATIGYYGIDTHYFLKLLIPEAQSVNLMMQHGQATEETCEVAIISYIPHGLIPPGDSVTLKFHTFFGPKDLSTLREYKPELEEAIDFGVFGFIARPLLLVIQGFYSVVGNYGLAIIMLTLLLKILFYPLMKASTTSAYRMKKFNPQMATLRERFKDDRQRQQQELVKFMAEHKINPMKGCLPILPQIPVFFAFYQVLRMAIELRHAPLFGWIQDLSAMDPYFVLPILLGAAMFAQQKLTPTTGMDKTQEKILQFMPVMFTALMLTLPAGMTLYMLTNTVTGIAQQKWLYRKLDKTAAK